MESDAGLRAVVCTKYGPPDVLQLKEIPKPTPKDNEVLIRVRATTVMAGDCELRGSKGSLPWQVMLRLGFGFRAPRRKVLGQDLAGEVESTGKDVMLFKTGDHVFGNTGLRLGAYAEYVCLTEDGMLVTKPANTTFEEAATFPSGGLYVLPLLGRVNVQSGQKVMIIGAAGTMGNIAVQLARLNGAEVTGVDSSNKLEMVRSIGADKVIDFTKEDYTKAPETYDVIFDVTGKSSFSGCVSILKQGGTYIMGNLGLPRMVRGRFASRRGKRIIAGYTSYQRASLDSLKHLVEEGRLRPVIDRRFPIEEIAEAHRYVDTGEKQGNVVVTVD
jgi:NADPH:quinone reductase-like Zn-dependent oxidoreductase